MIHKTAIVHAGAELAGDVEIGPYTVVGEGVRLGSGCRIGPHVVLNGPMSMGAGNRVFQFCSIGEAPQDLKYADEPTLLEIGSGNTFREYSTVNRGTVGGGGVTRIGNDNLFMGYTHVAHDCVIANNVIFANAAQIAGHVEIGDFAILGGFTNVHQFTHLGEHCFTGISTVVTRDVPPFVSVAGGQGKAYGINKNGLRRRGFDEGVITALHQAYKLLVHRRGPRDVALGEVQSLCDEFPEVRRFTDFIVQSERGIVR
jgi:UDP-N-acetylglucosamine acyltransferase